MHHTRRWIVSLLGLVLIGASTGAAAPDNPQTPEDLARARLEIARRIYRRIEEQIKSPPVGVGGKEDVSLLVLEQIPMWSRRWMEAERDLNDGRATQIAALEDHIKRLKPWEETYEEFVRAGEFKATQQGLDTLKFYRLEAEYRLAKEKAKK